MICKHELICTNKNIHCGECLHNPNAKLEDYFSNVCEYDNEEYASACEHDDEEYASVCEHGYNDCIRNPAIILSDYDNNSWIQKLFSKEELINMVKEGCHCKNGCDYDDECK